MSGRHAHPTITHTEIRELIDWIARLPEFGRPLRGSQGPERRLALERYARECLQRPECKIPQHRGDRWTSHSLMDKRYYPLEFLRLALIERSKELR
jgi:hypothetical protein